MIRTLSGTITHKTPDTLIVECGGVGYLVYCPTSVTAHYESGSQAELWIHHNVSDDSIDLYGFQKRDDLELFELLLHVSGIGPKKALSIMTIADGSRLRHAISSEESKRVADVAGVGKKVADKIILELKNKIEADTEEVDETTSGAGSDETEEALVALGYTLKEARAAAAQVPEEVTDVSERVKEALKRISA